MSLNKLKTLILSLVLLTSGVGICSTLPHHKNLQTSEQKKKEGKITQRSWSRRLYNTIRRNPIKSAVVVVGAVILIGGYHIRCCGRNDSSSNSNSTSSIPHPTLIQQATGSEGNVNSRNKAQGNLSEFSLEKLKDELNIISSSESGSSSSLSTNEEKQSQLIILLKQNGWGKWLVKENYKGLSNNVAFKYKDLENDTTVIELLDCKLSEFIHSIRNKEYNNPDNYFLKSDVDVILKALITFTKAEIQKLSSV